MPLDKKKQGRVNRRRGADFERLVRSDLEEKGYLVSKYQNNVEFDDNYYPARGKLIAAKASRFRLQSTGFPDFIVYRNCAELSKVSRDRDRFPEQEIWGVECKSNGYLSKEEKKKCEWLTRNGVFDCIIIAKKVKIKGRIKIEYNMLKETGEVGTCYTL